MPKIWRIQREGWRSLSLSYLHNRTDKKYLRVLHELTLPGRLPSAVMLLTSHQLMNPWDAARFCAPQTRPNGTAQPGNEVGCGDYVGNARPPNICIRVLYPKKIGLRRKKEYKERCIQSHALLPSHRKCYAGISVLATFGGNDRLIIAIHFASRSYVIVLPPHTQTLFTFQPSGARYRTQGKLPPVRKRQTILW